MAKISGGIKDDGGDEMRRIDMETILICVVVAAAASLGIMGGAAAFVGVSLRECSPSLLAWIGGVLGGGLWGILLIFNRNTVSKRG